MNTSAVLASATTNPIVEDESQSSQLQSVPQEPETVRKKDVFSYLRRISHKNVLILVPKLERHSSEGYRVPLETFKQFDFPKNRR
jgi:hypothetical protein